MSKFRRRAAIALALVTVAASAGTANAATLGAPNDGGVVTVSFKPVVMMVICGGRC